MFRIRKNDVVQLIVGRDKGKTGKVLQVFPREETILVEKLNIVKRHSRPTKNVPQGGIVEKESPIPLSNVLPFCSKCKEGVRIKASLGKNNEKIRTCQECGERIGK